MKKRYDGSKQVTTSVINLRGAGRKMKQALHGATRETLIVVMTETDAGNTYDGATKTTTKNMQGFTVMESKGAKWTAGKKGVAIAVREAEAHRVKAWWGDEGKGRCVTMDWEVQPDKMIRITGVYAPVKGTKEKKEFWGKDILEAQNVKFLSLGEPSETPPPLTTNYFYYYYFY